jgi:hypothetical protein
MSTPDVSAKVLWLVKQDTPSRSQWLRWQLDASGPIMVGAEDELVAYLISVGFEEVAPRMEVRRFKQTSPPSTNPPVFSVMFKDAASAGHERGGITQAPPLP